MDNRGFKVAEKTRQDGTSATDSNETLDQRLAWFAAENARIQRELADDASPLSATFTAHPYDFRRTYSLFGLLLGILPPLTYLVGFGLKLAPSDKWLCGLFAIVNLLSAVVGFFSGRFIGNAMKTVETLSWPVMLAILPLLGLSWGIVTGAAAGVVVFGVGALFGGIVGGAVGAAALPVFGTLHRLFKQGDVIERDKFFPLAFGVTLTICAAILRMYLAN